MNLDTPIIDAGKAYKMYAKRLLKLDIQTLGDLLMYKPARYKDMSIVSKISSLQEGEEVTIKGKVVDTKRIFTRRFLTIQKAVIEDETGEIECTWFNQNYILNLIKKDDIVSVFGKIGKSGNKLTLFVNEFEVVENEFSATVHTGRLTPVYHETRGVSSKWIRNRIFSLLSNKIATDEYLPEEIIKRNNLISLSAAIRKMHMPASLEDAENARKRLAFDELLITQAAVASRKKAWERKKVSHVLTSEKFEAEINSLYKNLPFQLTNAQKREVAQILSDISKNVPMNRMLEGDVGSGKTVVAAIAMYVAFLNGLQSALMAPTEILAQQHFDTIRTILEPLGVGISLFTSTTRKDKDKNLKSNFDIAIGTHALVHKHVKFDSLSLVVIDEQHRFGVEQRAILREKGKTPHFLSMTATPIPRTVFLTVYGDLDLSILDELPDGRKRIKTFLVPEEKREKGYEWMEKKLKKHEQMFVVCPFIETSESMTTVKAATVEFERLKKIFKNQKLGLLHGRLKAKEKEDVLKSFRNGRTKILVTTPVVEVGVDIPNATIMLIEAAERFGLASLHQLRGRVGRNDKESYCFLFTESESPNTLSRLKNLEKIQSGAELSELDLKLRGAGDMFGTAQHGLPSLKIASFSDFDLIRKTRDEAYKIAENIEAYPLLKEKLKNSIIAKVTPD